MLMIKMLTRQERQEALVSSDNLLTINKTKTVWLVNKSHKISGIRGVEDKIMADEI